MNGGRRFCSSLSAALVALAALTGPATAFAQSAPPSYVASPEIYKLISENDQFRVILATWTPRQRDAWHSHAGPLASYRLSDCMTRSFTPDGKTMDRDTKRGEVAYNPVIDSHSVQNVGATNCQLLIVERKQ